MKPTILLIEDSPTFAQHFVDQMALFADVDVAKTAAEGLRLLNADRGRNYAAIVADYFLPGQIGDEVVRAIVAVSLAPVFLCSSSEKISGTVIANHRVLTKGDKLLEAIEELLNSEERSAA